MTGVEKTKKVLTTVWSATVQGVESTSNVVSAKSKEFGEKWDNSQTGQKINLGAKVAGEKTKEIAVVGWEKTKEGISALKENETVQAVTAKTVEKTKEWSTGLWGWMKKKIGDDVAAQAPAPAAPQAPVAEQNLHQEAPAHEQNQFTDINSAPADPHAPTQEEPFVKDITPEMAEDHKAPSN